MPRGIYLIHFNQPYKHAAHYLGFAGDIAKRLAKHEAGNGSRLMQVIKDAGITWTLARIWPEADRNEERRLKNMGSSKRHCPICNQWHDFKLSTKSAKIKAFVK